MSTESPSAPPSLVVELERRNRRIEEVLENLNFQLERHNLRRTRRYDDDVPCQIAEVLTYILSRLEPQDGGKA